MSASSEHRDAVLDAQDELLQAQDAYRARPTAYGRELVEVARANLAELTQQPPNESADAEPGLLDLVRRWFGGAHAAH